MFDSLSFEQLYTLSTALTQLIENAEEHPITGDLEPNPIAEEMRDEAERRMLELVGV